MKVLVISPYPLLPPIHGGRVRTAGLASGLARAGATVAVLCPWFPQQPRAAEIEDRLSLHSHFLGANLLPAALSRSSASPLALISLQPHMPWGPRRHLADFSDFDVFQLEFCANAEWIDLLPQGSKVVYSSHNVERDFYAAEGKGSSLHRWSLRRLEQLERHAVRDSDRVLCCSDQDATRLRDLYGPAPTAIVPNGSGSSLLQLDRGELRESARDALGFGPDDRVLVFVGGDAAHNRDAVHFLVRSVVPQLDRRTRLLIVGKCGNWERNRRGDRVVSLGFVPDLVAPLAAADVAVNPVGYGTGSNVKLAEYLAARLPVVSTPVGVRGFEQVADAVRVVPLEGFAEALRGPLPGPERDRSLLESLTWDAVGGRLFDEYTRLLEQRESVPLATA